MGRAVAERFLTEGWDVVGVDRDAVAAAPAYRPVTVDITDRAALADALSPLPPGLRAVVNAAGIYPTTTLPTTTRRSTAGSSTSTSWAR
jgi:2,3-dihydro-2,3-dihydroxybenzoate dehydrogenase